MDPSYTVNFDGRAMQFWTGATAHCQKHVGFRADAANKHMTIIENACNLYPLIRANFVQEAFEVLKLTLPMLEESRRALTSCPIAPDGLDLSKSSSLSDAMVAKLFISMHGSETRIM
eukprot:1968142-Pyramimonas_sp.AAC.1